MFSHIKEFFTRPSGYNLQRSVRLRSSASAYLNRTPASASNRKTWTWSGWVKRGTLGTEQSLFATVSQGFSLFFGTGNDLRVWTNGGNAAIYTSAVYRDVSAWYHIVLQRTSVSPYFNLYVNGVQVTAFAYDNRATYPSTADSEVNNTVAHYISGLTSYYFDGYLTEINFIDGQALTPSSFGETDSITGVWKAKKYGGTYGTNGFYLNFSDNSSNTATTIGKDYSGNGNNWTPNNISVTAGSTYDSMTDVPTLTSATAANYCTWSPIDSNSACTFANGNLQVTTAGSGNDGHTRSTFGVSSGKWYWEITPITSGSLAIGIDIGFIDVSEVSSYIGNKFNSYGYHSDNAKFNNAVRTTYGATYAANNVMGVALDMDAGTLTFYKDNVSQGTAFTGLLSGFATPAVSDGGGSTGQTYNANFGQQPFVYTPPTGFVALNTYNLPASTITNGGLYMKPVLYTGDGTTNKSITGVGFQTDFNWTKSRSSASYSHQLSDSVRGFSKYLYSNATNAEGTDATNHIQSVNSDGYVINSGASFNASGVTYVAWNWKAGTTSASNTNGSITSTVSAGATQGFSVVTYTGTGSNATVGHGLGVAPSMIIIKGRDTGYDWRTYHASVGNTSALFLNTTSGSVASSTYWNNTSPTSSVFSVGSNAGMNGSTNTYVAYCFSAVAGYSAFGSYTGNSSTDGPFVYLGFRPRFVMIKKTSGVSNWWILDTSRDTYNVADRYLYAESSDAEDTRFLYDFVDILSNGFKLRSTNSTNSSSATYVYACFAESPFKTSLAR